MTQNRHASFTFSNNVRHSSLSREIEDLAAVAPDPTIATGLRKFGTVWPGGMFERGMPHVDKRDSLHVQEQMAGEEVKSMPHVRPIFRRDRECTRKSTTFASVVLPQRKWCTISGAPCTYRTEAMYQAGISLDLLKNVCR